MVIVFQGRNRKLQYSKIEMMIPKLYNAAFISAAFLLSCAGSNNNDYIDKSLIPPATENKSVQVVNNTAPVAQPANAQPGIPGSTTTIPATNSINVTPANNTIKTNPQTANVKLNPPHGQPGHRCDIAVGAPLDSKPVQLSTQPAPIVSTPQPIPQTTAPGMNPPHGQPGHRCDIAVGEPLNTPKANAPTPVSVDPATVKPAKPDSTKNQ